MGPLMADMGTNSFMKFIHSAYNSYIENPEKYNNLAIPPSLERGRKAKEEEEKIDLSAIEKEKEEQMKQEQNFYKDIDTINEEINMFFDQDLIEEKTEEQVHFTVLAHLIFLDASVLDGNNKRR